MTNSSSFLLEIGTEDLPARFLPAAIQQLKEKTELILKENHIKFSEIKTYGTPRRLAVIADGLPQMQEDRSKEVFGPSKNAAFDKNGSPTKAAIGFANSQGVSVKSLIIKNKDRGEYVAAVIEEKGLHVRELLPELFKRITLSLHFSKSMRWGTTNIKFIRPIRWLMAIFDKETITFEIDGIKSNNVTKGHRFLSPAAFQIKDIPGYKRILSNNHVVVDPEERKYIIAEKMEKLLTPVGGKPVEDKELLETVVNLVEYPVPVLGTFSEEYLELPKELLINVMKGHQKYFAVQNVEGLLTNQFIIISNTDEENSDTVRIGAERVIKARFEDARFYFKEDIKKPLSERIDELRKVTFQENLGSLYEKTERIVFISEFLAERLLPSAKDNLIRIAKLAKTDLVTGVVREFPELQGIMGKYYALHDREESEVANALEEQYLPAHSGGRLPKTDFGAFLSIADKIDNIASFFSIGFIPTGSEDPFALRRQALGIIAIILDKGFGLTLKELVDKALEKLPDVKNIGEARNNILQFFENRLETVFSDLGYSSDLIDSIISLSLDLHLNDIKERLDALTRFKEEKGYNNFLLAIKRVSNIIPKAEIPLLNSELLIEEPENRLKEKLDSLKPDFVSFIKNTKYYDAINLLSSLTDPVNHFFDQVLVMDKREEIRQNRFALLKEIWTMTSLIADFSRLKENG
ncbi:MAG: glycine--tRNA ligase subunit beta [Nitrospirae bacterium RBG_13_39_12]|nr:MAG: glycine--tRNA ligase subunit beta [Nitrospirae bacterium RBG_13_39_12]